MVDEEDVSRRRQRMQGCALVKSELALSNGQMSQKGQAT